MAGADGDSPAAAAERLMARAARMRDLSPVLRTQAASLEKRISDAFRSETSPAGEKWPPLAASTLEARAAKLPGAKKRDRDFGDLSDKAKRIRANAVNAARRGSRSGIKMLVDSGRLRGGIAVLVEGTSLVFTGPLYLRTHVQGDPERNIPQRNPLPLEVVSGDPVLAQAANAELHKAVVRYINTGEAA